MPYEVFSILFVLIFVSFHLFVIIKYNTQTFL